jgi:hypothetical protein
MAQMELNKLLEDYLDGDEVGWRETFEELRVKQGHRIRVLTRQILDRGIVDPNMLGDDGRIWDGHHRIYIAFVLGFTHVPVKPAREY